MSTVIVDAEDEVEIEDRKPDADHETSLQVKVSGKALEKSAISGKGRKKGNNPRISFCLDTNELKAPRASAEDQTKRTEAEEEGEPWEDGDPSSFKQPNAQPGLDPCGEENGDEQASSGNSDQESSAG